MRRNYKPDCYQYRTCVHNKEEGLDSHDCIDCQIIARELGCDMSNGKTYIFTSETQINELRKEKLK